MVVTFVFRPCPSHEKKMKHKRNRYKSITRCSLFYFMFRYHMPESNYSLKRNISFNEEYYRQSSLIENEIIRVGGTRDVLGRKFHFCSETHWHHI